MAPTNEELLERSEDYRVQKEVLVESPEVCSW